MDNVVNTRRLQQDGMGEQRRRYRSGLRQAQAERTRHTILDAGRELIIERGYARTTMRQIAERAEVAVETVYLHFRSKRALLTTLLDLAHGGEEGLPVAQRDWVRQVHARPDAIGKLRTAAANLAAVYRHLAPLYIAVRAAVDAEPDARQLWNARATERRAGLERFARELVDTGQIRTGLTVADVSDSLFALASPEMYGLLVLDTGWPPERYQDWLTRTLLQQLTTPASACHQAEDAAT